MNCLNPIRAQSAGALLLLGWAIASQAADLPVRWHALNTPANLGRVEAVAISPTDSNRLLAGGDVLGAGLSCDGGVTWDQALGITECYELNDFTFHPTNPAIVWVGSLSGPYRSIDGGHHWALRRGGMPPMNPDGLTAPIQKVLFDPNDAATLLALGGNHRHMGYGKVGTTAWGGVWKSRDGGQTWTRLATIDDGAVGAPEDGTGVQINDAGFAAGSSSVVFACSDQGGVYKSTDGGRHFDRANNGLPNTEAWALALHPQNPNVLWVALGGGAGIWQSTDGADHWTAATNGMTDLVPTSEFRTLAIARSAPNYLYCASWRRNASVYRSTDGGATWTRVLTNGHTETIRGGTGNPGGLFFQWLTVDARNPLHLLGAGEGNVVQSFDGGTSWKDITCFPAGQGWRGNGYSGLCCTTVAWNPFKPGQVFTLGMDGGKLLRSDDYLWSWRLADPGLIGPYNSGNSASFANNGTIYVGSGQFGNTSGAYRNEPIIKSVDWGATWKYVHRPADAKGDNKSVYVAPQDANQVWAIIGDTLYQSRDGGDKWQPLALRDAGTLWNLAPDPKQPGRLYVGTRNGVFETSDGTHFNRMPGSPRSSQFEYVYTDPVVTGRAYAVSFNSGSLGGVYRYTGTWTRIFSKPQARALAIDPGNPHRLAVLAKWWPARDFNRADGVWFSSDDGEHWTQCNDGLRMLSGPTIAFNPDKSGQLILGTDGAGFYVADLGVSTPFGKAPANLPGTVQAEDYDRGGRDVAFHSSAGSASANDSYRNDGAWVVAGGTGHVLRLRAPGDWFKYRVSVATPGLFKVHLRVGAAEGARLHLEADGVNVTGPIPVPAAGPKQDWGEVSGKARLDAGQQYLKLYLEAGALDLNYFRIEPATEP